MQVLPGQAGGSGLLDPQAENVSAYAVDYSSRVAEAELAAIEEKAGKGRSKGKAKATA